MKYSVLTTFPSFFSSAFETSILGRAIATQKILIDVVNLRDFTSDQHRTTDDTPYGGGPGMVMMIEPIDRALAFVKQQSSVATHCVVLTARGKRFTQIDAIRLSQLPHVTIICGHYGDIDQRVVDHIADEELSIGDFVLTGGEVGALVLIDATARLVSGVLGNADSLHSESHQIPGQVSPPQYTRPATYKGWSVPTPLLSGDPKQIVAWQQAQLAQ